jgi:hypothetical protein
MKRVFLLVSLIVLVASIGVPSASAQRPCSERVLRAAAELGSLDSGRYGLQLYIWERCGQRVGIPFG